ncbi:MAG: universal stress protein [Polyangiales bacterium]
MAWSLLFHPTMRHYVCSVENGKTVPLEVRRILVPVDFSEYSWAALMYAIDLAERTGAAVDALHVVDLPPYPAMGKWRDPANDERPLPSLEQHVHELATERMSDLVTQVAREGVEINGIVDEGEAVPVISRRAPEYDLIVIGAHDDEAVQGLFFGNVTDRLAGEVHTPVISVRVDEDQDVAERRASIG